MNLFGMNNNYSFLFSGLSGNNAKSYGISNMNFLSDYASIKNGSYGKLLKAYYKKVAGTDSTTESQKTESQKTEQSKPSRVTTSTAADTAKTLSNIDQAADKLKASADALTATGEKSVFAQKEVSKTLEDGSVTKVQEYDKSAIYDAVSDFVSNYNSLIDAVNGSASSSIRNAASNMTNITSVYSNSLSSVGITAGSDQKLSINSDELKSASLEKLQKLFHEIPSFGKSISSQASFVDFTASREAAKANTYNRSAFYNSNYSVGNLYHGFF